MRPTRGIRSCAREFSIFLHVFIDLGWVVHMKANPHHLEELFFLLNLRGGLLLEHYFFYVDTHQYPQQGSRLFVHLSNEHTTIRIPLVNGKNLENGNAQNFTSSWS